MIGKVLHDRQIEIERPRLEHDAEPAQRFGRGAVHIEAKNANAASLCCEQAGYQAKERAFAGAIEAEKDGEVAWATLKPTLSRALRLP